MFKVIFDPFLFSEGEYIDADSKLKTLIHLEKILDFVSKYLECEFDLFDHAPYFEDDNRPPFTHYDYPALGRMIGIRKRIMGLLSNSNYVDLNGTPFATFSPDLINTLSSETNEALHKYLSYIHSNDLGCLFFISKRNVNSSHLDYKIIVTCNSISFEIFPIVDPNTNCTSKIYKAFKEQYRHPDLTLEFFPNKELCSELNTTFKEIKTGKNREELKALIILFADEMAFRNGYVYDATLSKKNTTDDKKRRVYTAIEEKKIIRYLSIDLESGGFEVFDKHKIHQGQYDFSGIKSKTANPDNHKIYT